MGMRRAFLIAVLVVAAAAWADDKKLKGTVKKTAPKLDLGLQPFGDIPKGAELAKPKAAEENADTRSSAPGEKVCSVVSVQHAKGFVRGTDGARPSSPMPVLPASGSPLRTDKFVSMVRVKCTDKRNREIAVAILDPAQDTVMDASGQLFFAGKTETEWQVDWDATSIRRVGDYGVLVRVGGEALGTFPLKIDVPSADDGGKTNR